MSFVEQGHLGGYIAGGDEATYYPELWRWLVAEFQIRSVIDVGCGEGHALRFFRDLGCHTRGIDGIAQPDRDIIRHDFTEGTIKFQQPYDLCWSCEFVEHVEEHYIQNFLNVFAVADLVLMTHAEPGQQGYHHVNCQPAAYWVGVMAAIGYPMDDALTMQTRVLAQANPSPWNHYARSGLAFVSSAAREKMSADKGS